MVKTKWERFHKMLSAAKGGNGRVFSYADMDGELHEFPHGCTVEAVYRESATLRCPNADAEDLSLVYAETYSITLIVS